MRRRGATHSRVTDTLPARWYWSPEIFERERTTIFGREWQVLGAASSVAQTGQCLSGDIAGWPVVAVRGRHGVLRAFHNVCRHRASTIVRERTETCAALQCPYHGWTYGLDGSLKVARDFGEEVPDLPLRQVRVETWRGLVFVNLDVGASFDLDGFATACDEFDMESFELVAEASRVLRCNWKTYADNYGASELGRYHIPFVHPELNRQLDARAYRVEVFDRWTRHSAPMSDGSPASGVWLWRYPNLALNVYAGGMNVERFTPLDARTTRIDYSFFFRDGIADEEAMKLASELLAEDADICEGVQRNLEAGVHDIGRLSPTHEGGLALLQRLVRAAVES